MANILIADDDAPSRNFLAGLLVSRSHRALEAVNGREALEIARQQLPDLVLSDVLMPLMDGFELLRQLQLDPATKSIPVILISGAYDGDAARALAAAGGAVALVPKPYRPKEIFEQIDAALAPDRCPTETAAALKAFEPEHLRLLMDKLSEKAAEAERACERLRKSESLLAEAQALAHIGSWEWDIITDTVTWSDEKYRIMGFEPQEVPVTYAFFLNCLHPDDRTRIDEAVQQAYRDHQPSSYDYRAILPDGRVRLLHVEATVVTDECGRATRMLGTAQDITDRKLAEEALRESETRFRQLAENISEVFWLSNPEGTLKHYVSPAYEKIWGRSCDSLYAEPTSWKDSIHSDDRERIAENQRLQPVHGKHDLTYRIVRPDGTVRWIRDRAFPVRDESGNLIRVAGIAEDITERKEAERQIEHFADLFKALSHHLLNVQEEERRHLSRELHDEIGQTLTAAKLNLKIIAPDVPAAVADRLDDSIQMLDRLLMQVRQISLDLRPPLLDELGLVPALRWLADQQARRSGLRVAFTADVEHVEMDLPLRTACFRVAQEAITNAIRHARAVSVAVELRAEPDRIRLVVRDDGVGFDEGAMQQRATHGASLGLLSMKERVSLLRGELEVNSAPGRGTEIRAWFPLALIGPDVTTQNA